MVSIVTVLAVGAAVATLVEVTVKGSLTEVESVEMKGIPNSLNIKTISKPAGNTC